MTEKSQNGLALALLLAVAVIWGSSFILIKKGLLVYSPQQVALLRVSFAWIVLVPSALIHLRRYFKKSGWLLAVSGIIGNFIPAFLFATAQTQLDSGITGILNSLTPLFTMVVGVLAFSLAMQARQLMGLLLGLSGSIVLSLIGSGGTLGSMNFYALFVILASFCYGTNVNIIKKYFAGIPSFRLTAMSLFFIGPPSLVLLFLTDFNQRLVDSPGAWQALGFLAVLGIVNTSIALVLFNKLIKMTSPVTASSVTYIIPVIALVFGVWDGEPFYMWHVLGMSMIVGGVYLINRR